MRTVTQVSPVVAFFFVWFAEAVFTSLLGAGAPFGEDAIR
jgi:hypothetical protein